MKKHILSLGGAIALTASTAWAAHHGVGAVLINADGHTIGRVEIVQGPTGVLIHVEARDIPPGPHGIHIHGVGKCEPDFKASKGHVNTKSKPHGLLNPAGPDNGDLPNIYAAADGRVRAEIFTTRISVEGADASMLDADGSAIVIHAERDDHSTQPIGGAGGRIACGVIERM